MNIKKLSTLKPKLKVGTRIAVFAKFTKVTSVILDMSKSFSIVIVIPRPCYAEGKLM